MTNSILTPGSKVWIVARHSPGKSQSIHSQIVALSKHCEANQLIIVDEFIDSGESGSNRQRAEFNRMIELAESSDAALVDGVVFYDLSRLARDFDNAQYVKSMLRRKGYVIEWVIGERYEGIAGAILETVEDYQNAEFIAKIRQKSKDGLRAMIQLKDEEGNYIGFWPGRVPWGYKPVQKVLPVLNTITGQYRRRQCIAPDYDAWDLGRELFRLRIAGLTVRQIEEKTGWLGSRGTVNIDNSNVLNASYYKILPTPDIQRYICVPGINA